MEENDVINAILELRRYQTETNKLEAKLASSGFPKKCYDTISSFANKYGGIIIFGLDENNCFASEGVYDLSDLQKQISALCSDSMEPAIRPDILPIEYEGKQLLAVKIDEIPQNKKPCYYKPKGLQKGSYIRIGERDEIMTDYEIYSYLSYNDHIFEDKRPTRGATIDDLNMDSLNYYIFKIRLENPNFAKNDFDKSLKLCGITDISSSIVYPTLAGMMIFGEYPQSFYPQLFVACVVIPGNTLGDISENGERFLDNKRIEGTIEEMLEGTMNFIRRNMKTSISINSNGERINRTEYPIDALREAVANALIHRDYSVQTENAYISVNMFNDRIEIINPGKLYGTNSLEKLGNSTGMEARNPTIIRILEGKDSVIENRHSGIPTMKREMLKYGLPEPEFYEERDSFKVIFRNGKNGQQNDETRQQNYDRRQQNYDRRQQINEGSGQQINEGSGQQINEESGQQIHNNCLKIQPNSEFDSNLKKAQKSGQQNIQESGQQNNIVNTMQIQVLKYCRVPHSLAEIKQYLHINSRSYVSAKIIKPLIENGLLEYTNKKSIYARNQKYISTSKIVKK